LIDKATALMPDVGIGTDIIVGFPGEGEAEFENTCKVVEELPFSYLHVFSYSDRPKTHGMKLTNKNSPETIKRRSEIMHEIGDRKKREFAEKHIGTDVEVLVERRDENGRWNGFTGEYLKVFFEDERDLHNRMETVTVTAREGEAARGV
jgi:threonylcarbamoyladenosine tRNA methylthiotransferase MtaB